jgi:hypothetical protein
MAKLTAPLLSFDASGQLAKTLVFFPWKGLKVARQYVVPTNPDTPAQQDQRGYLTDIVAKIHTAQQEADPLDAVDVAAYAAWAAIQPTPRTWFNQACANYMAQYAAGKQGAIFLAGATTPGVDEIAITVDFLDGAANFITAGNFHYGTSKSNLMYTEAAVVAAKNASATLSGLVTGLRYYIQFRATLHADYIGVQSGIYSDIAG